VAHDNFYDQGQQSLSAATQTGLNMALEVGQLNVIVFPIGLPFLFRHALPSLCNFCLIYSYALVKHSHFGIM